MELLLLSIMSGDSDRQEVTPARDYQILDYTPIALEAAARTMREMHPSMHTMEVSATAREFIREIKGEFCLTKSMKTLQHLWECGEGTPTAYARAVAMYLAQTDDEQGACFLGHYFQVMCEPLDQQSGRMLKFTRSHTARY